MEINFLIYFNDGGTHVYNFPYALEQPLNYFIGMALRDLKMSKSVTAIAIRDSDKNTILTIAKGSAYGKPNSGAYIM